MAGLAHTVDERGGADALLLTAADPRRARAPRRRSRPRSPRARPCGRSSSVSTRGELVARLRPRPPRPWRAASRPAARPSIGLGLELLAQSRARRAARPHGRTGACARSRSRAAALRAPWRSRWSRRTCGCCSACSFCVIESISRSKRDLVTAELVELQAELAEAVPRPHRPRRARRRARSPSSSDPAREHADDRSRCRLLAARAGEGSSWQAKPSRCRRCSRCRAPSCATTERRLGAGGPPRRRRRRSIPTGTRRVSN